jgi:hypothetical protein
MPSLFHRIKRLFITPYEPDPEFRTFMDRSVTQEDDSASATVAVLTAKESRRFFGVDLAHRGIQPVFLKIENRSAVTLRLQMVNIDPRYFTAMEAAAVTHFSMGKRLSAFGAMSWFFLPLVWLIPFKMITAHWANQRMDAFFRDKGFRIGGIRPNETVSGFVFTTLDLGTKTLRIQLASVGNLRQTVDRLIHTGSIREAPTARSTSSVNMLFTIPVPGIDADYLDRDFTTIQSRQDTHPCSIDELSDHLNNLPSATSNGKGTGHGDPVNLVVIGSLQTILSAFTARWDESETISLKTCWKTAKAFLLGENYRYSPVSPLYLFERPQDIALQRTRHSINERIHLRLWMTPMEFLGEPVWAGQVSRDIGVRFTTKTWNLTTHRIDPNVDESRDYCIEDLTQAGRVIAAGYVNGVGRCEQTKPKRNLTGDPYFTDGKRAVIVISHTHAEH